MNTLLLVYFTLGNGEDDGVKKTEEKVSCATSGMNRFWWNELRVIW